MLPVRLEASGLITEKGPELMMKHDRGVERLRLDVLS